MRAWLSCFSRGHPKQVSWVSRKTGCLWQKSYLLKVMSAYYVQVLFPYLILNWMNLEFYYYLHFTGKETEIERG